MSQNRFEKKLGPKIVYDNKQTVVKAEQEQ